MRYLLALLTMKGRESEVEHTLETFERYVTPMPTALHCHVDGATSLPRLLYGGMPWEGDVDPEPVGFCRSAHVVWEAALTHTDCDWVFWIEDDCEFVRPVNLGLLTHVMEAIPEVVQMALPGGGGDEIYRHNPERMATMMGDDGSTRPLADDECSECDEAPWFSHTGHWETPCMFRRDLAEEFELPEGPRCERKLGFTLRAGIPGALFGVWGGGAVWVRHEGDRLPAGTGY